jgi:hypothetical protein
MKSDKLKSLLTGVPSWVLALISMFITAIVMMAISEICYVCGYTTLAVLIPIACFRICWNDPKSVWYIPLLCNTLSLLPVFGDEGIWPASVWIIFCSGWILSVMMAITGARLGKSATISDDIQNPNNSQKSNSME